MNAEIVQMPDTMHRQWRVYEAGFQELMRANGIDAEVAKIALDRLKPIYLRYSAPHAIQESSDPEAVLKQVNIWASQLATGLMTEIILREIALINLRGKGG